MKFDALFIPIPDWRLCEEFIELFPVAELYKLVAAKQERVNNLINALSYTQANGWMWLINGFGGNNGKWSDLLPMRTDTDGSDVDGFSDPTPKTLEILSLLHKQRKIPRNVMIDLGGLGILNKLD